MKLDKPEKELVALVIIIIVIAIIIPIIYIVTKKVVYPIKYDLYVEKYSEKYDVDKYLIYAIIKAESKFNEKAESNKGAKGLMQLMYVTAKEVASKIEVELSEENIFEADININVGTKYISQLLEKYNNCTELALAAYNAGSGKVDSWIKEGTLEQNGSNIENIPYKETNNYVRKILRDYKIYKELYE